MRTGRHGPYSQTTERLPRIAELRALGLSYREIGPMVGLTTSAVHSIALRHGIAKKRTKRPPRPPAFPGVLALARARLQHHERSAEIARHWKLSA